MEPRVGIGVIIKKENQVLFGNRINSHGHDTWSLPGGHLEFSEGISTCAKREVFEETGLEIAIKDFGPYTNDFFQNENKHYVTLYVLADYISGTPKVMEPDKCKEWKWVYWNDLPKPLFLPIENLLRQNYNPFD